MKDKEYALQLLNTALEDFASAQNDVTRLVALTQIKLLNDLLEPGVISSHVMLLMQDVVFALMVEELEKELLVMLEI